MKLEATMRYPADCRRVSEVTLDPEFQDAKCVATGALSHEVDINTDGEHAVVKTVRRMPTSDLPDFVRSLVKDGITVVETDVWSPPAADGSRDATVEVRFAGAPIEMHGTIALRPDRADGENAVARLQADLKASIPLIGGRIEKACAQAVLAAVKVEERTAGEWLTSQ
jgi:hypothetical protein